MKDVSDEQIKVLEARRCRTFNNCECEPGNCDDFALESFTPDLLREYWTAIAAALGVPLPALVALARGDAVVVPCWLTPEMAANSVRAIVPGTSTPLWVKFADAGLTAECMMPAWDAALAQSPYKGGA
jgi:hypothetical protein